MFNKSRASAQRNAARSPLREGQKPASRGANRGPVPPKTPRLDRLGQLLTSLEGFPQPVDVTLSAYFKQSSALGGRERSFVAEGVYAAVRAWSAFDQVLKADGFDRSNPSRGRRMAMLAAARAVGLDRIVSEITPGERSWLLLAEEQITALPTTAERHSLPDWIWQGWVSLLGEAEAAALAEVMDQSAGLDLRVNVLKAQPQEVLKALLAEGVSASRSTVLRECLHVEGKPGLQRTPGFLNGDFEVQDLGSQLLARLCAPKRGSFVVDFCAGAGGKTLALGALMRNTGRLYALDRSSGRLAKLKPRMARSGLSNVWPIGISGLGDERLKRLRTKADLVLVDAPCTGLGTLRRNPDLKWRQSPEGALELQALQADILDAAALLVKPEGRLVYATCSTRLEENEAQAEAFLARHPDFERLPLDAVLERLELQLPADWYAVQADGSLRIWPHRSGTDGFYGVMFQRSNAGQTGMLAGDSE